MITIDSPGSVLVDGKHYGAVADTIANNPQLASDIQQALVAEQAIQCGFCTPGIVMRLAAIAPEQRTDTAVRQALLAHVCRCTGWHTVVEAALLPVAWLTGGDLKPAARLPLSEVAFADDWGTAFPGA